MRRIRRIVCHATAGWPWQTTESIKTYWHSPKPKGLGWKNVGYHFLINEDGTWEQLAQLSSVTNGVAGYNSDSVHISYKGGLTEIVKEKGKSDKYIYGDTRTPAQKNAFYEIFKIVFEELKKTQEVDDITIVGHRDLSRDTNNNGKIEEREWVKVCPMFNAIDEYGWIVGKKALERLKHRKTY